MDDLNSIIDYEKYQWRFVTISVVQLKEIIKDAIEQGGEGLIDIDSDDLDPVAVSNLTDSAMIRILMEGHLE